MVMAGLPSLRATGRKVWSRIRSGRDAESELLRALEGQVARMSLGQARAERAAQIARVLDLASALAAEADISEAEVQALRAARTARVPVVQGLTKQLTVRASDAVQQMRRHTEALGSVRARVSQVELQLPLHRAGWSVRPRPLFVVRVGRPAVADAGQRAQPRLVAASLLPLPHLKRRIVTLRRSADLAISTVKLVQASPASDLSQQLAAATVLVWSGRTSLQMTYRIAAASAQLLLRSYVLPRVVSVVRDVAARRAAPRVLLPPSRVR